MGRMTKYDESHQNHKLSNRELLQQLLIVFVLYMYTTYIMATLNP